MLARRAIESFVRVDDGVISIAAPLLGFKVDVVQDHRDRRDAGAAESIQRKFHELTFGTAPTNDQRYAVRCDR